jgi:uncharacterized DUF497 family protein
MEIAFEWDDAKAERNLAKHRMSFGKAKEAFSDPNLATVNATREEDGEARFKAIGRIGGRLYAVVYTQRGAVRRLISARRANAKEERSYGDRSQHV